MIRTRHRRLHAVVAATLVVVLGTAGCGGSAPAAAPSTLGPAEPTGPALDPDALVSGSSQRPVPLRVEVLAEVPTDASSFTQGLEFADDGRLFESSGGYGRSRLAQVDPASGLPVRQVRLDSNWFAEGLTLADSAAGQRLVLLTWREGVAAIYDPERLTELGRTSYEGEGWGICQLDPAPGQDTAGLLVMSDGTDTLTLRSPEDFSEQGRIPVTSAGVAQPQLNELECHRGLVWANVFLTDTIVAIDPASGRVVAEVDASGLLDRSAYPDADVLNGIAAIPGTDDEFLVSGKLWPSSFQVRFVPR